jgi:hypothetical protein
MERSPPRPRLGLAAGATFGAGTVLSKKLRFRSPVLLITI